MTDVRAAAQLSGLASLLTIAVPLLIAFSVIHATLALAVGLAAALLLLDGLGWRIVAVMVRSRTAHNRYSGDQRRAPGPRGHQAKGAP